jgi:hypothetical protein
VFGLRKKGAAVRLVSVMGKLGWPGEGERWLVERARRRGKMLGVEASGVAGS